MFNPDTAPALAYMPSIETAARSLKVEPIMAPVHDDVGIEMAIIALGREPPSGLVVTTDVFTSAHRALIISAAARNNVPALRSAAARAAVAQGPQPQGQRSDEKAADLLCSS
jgi:hypothetical protein